MAHWRVKCVVSGGIQSYTTLLLIKFRVQTHNKNLFSKNMLQIYDQNTDPIPSVWIISQQLCYFNLFLLIFLMLSLDFVISILHFSFSLISILRNLEVQIVITLSGRGS